MSTTLWLCEHNWEQCCWDCDYYPCVPSGEYDPQEPNDCDEFSHDTHEQETGA